mgnify:FL=1
MNVDKISKLINTAYNTHERQFCAQSGIFFHGDMDKVIKTLKSAGHHVQQNDGIRALIDHKVWISRNGVIEPIKHGCL